MVSSLYQDSYFSIGNRSLFHHSILTRTSCWERYSHMGFITCLTSIFITSLVWFVSFPSQRSKLGSIYSLVYLYFLSTIIVSFHHPYFLQQKKLKTKRKQYKKTKSEPQKKKVRKKVPTVEKEKKEKQNLCCKRKWKERGNERIKDALLISNFLLNDY